MSSGDPCVGDSDCSESCDEVGDACFTLLQAGAVPDGLRVPGIPLALAHSSVAGDLDLLWGASCVQTDDDYAVYEGVLGDFTSHVPVGIPDCTTGGATTTTITPSAGDRYYLVVPQLLSEGIEGSYGFASDGTPRTPSLSACGLQVVCECPTKTVFVTSATNDGDLGGLAGGDANCQNLADAAGLGGTYKAWLSDSATAVKDRFAQSTVPYVRTDGLVIADDWADLTDNPDTDPLLVPIDRDENSNAVASSIVWTGSTFAGNPQSTNQCSDWGDGTNASSGRVGRTNQVDRGWTSIATQTCEKLRRLYCFEQ